MKEKHVWMLKKAGCFVLGHRMESLPPQFLSGIRHADGTWTYIGRPDLVYDWSRCHRCGLFLAKKRQRKNEKTEVDEIIVCQ